MHVRVCVYICMYIYVCMYVCMPVCVYVCLFVCVCVWFPVKDLDVCNHKNVVHTQDIHTYIHAHVGSMVPCERFGTR